AGAIAGRLQHDDLGAGAGNTADRVQELALDERPALDLQTERHEEGGHDIEVGNGDSDVVEAAYIGHGPCSRRIDHVSATVGVLTYLDQPKRRAGATAVESSWV